MNRRRFLRNTSAVGALTLAGCIADPDDNSDDGGGSGGTPTPNSGDENTPEQPAVVGSSVELVEAGCNSGEDSSASVSMDEETSTVSFTGQVTTADPCYDVTLERAEYDADADRLAIVVGTESTDEMCVDCVGLVEFEGTVEFEGGLPGEAYVGHGDTILTGSGDDGSDDEPAGGDEPEAVELVAESFTVTETTSSVGSGDGTADVSFDPDEGTVVVTGTIIGSDGCTTAELGDASYDPTENRLSVDVVTTQREDADMCTEALVAIDYEATFTFEGGIPDEVSVSHDGRGVVGAGYDTASATPPEDA